MRIIVSAWLNVHDAWRGVAVLAAAAAVSLASTGAVLLEFVTPFSTPVPVAVGVLAVLSASIYAYRGASAD
ncbi:hypothetical protein SAMN05444365_105171 [Micromonospora pattaloongensis]|uniref:Uncharacterized protein n=1 Tax=Micromonospora pattaloongensis TaxID=405436 RepID=A0A1H3Q1Z4_9ACTN|nr:hypothetical protein [Micromonospora pattaloongensis]SDZ07253.1 hypothetical protein SAMN05444365_105171 [Micromonospora pattaloongensis]